MNIRFITQLDTFNAVAKFHSLVYGDPWGDKTPLRSMTDERMPHKTLFLRVQRDATRDNWLDDLPMFDEPDYEKWNSLRSLLGKAKKAIFADQFLRNAIDPEAAPGRIVISVLKPHSYMAWHTDEGEYAKRHLRFHIPLQTNIGCFLHCRHESQQVPVGGLVALNAREPHCATNWGDTFRSHVIFELRRRDAPEIGQ